MSESAEGSPPKPGRVIEPPKFEDPEEFNSWLDKYVEKPDISHADSKHPDGTPYRIEEQIELTKDQLRLVAKEFPKMGKPDALIIGALIGAVDGLQKDPQERK